MPLLASLSLPVALLAGDAPLHFNRDIRPILSNHCFECHGPDDTERQANLRLDQPGAAAIVPGAPGASELVRRIRAQDDGERMPPPDFRHPLEESQRRILERWIEEGAEYEAHWAYAQMRRTPVPAAAPETDPIDAFLSARQKEAGVVFAAEADRRTLIRRLSFDLLGLPPTPEEVDAFLNDDTPGAYEELVDRLLASPHHAERLALFWLDLVRYADTVGYHGDQEWRVWPYRDWVIDAFHDNMPFDRFTIEQLAGDLLPEATLQQQVAASYNRLNMVTFEGGSQAKEFLLKYAADRVRTTTGAWLGSTVGCAECHDHKFDPFTTRDFYSLSAYFADIQEEGVYTRFQDGHVPPELAVPSAAQSIEVARLQAELASAREALDESARQAADDRQAWEREMRARMREDGEAVDVTWVDDAQGNGGSTQGTWDFVGAEVVPVHSGSLVRRQRSEALVQHFFDDAQRRVVLGEDEHFFAWVWIDPQDPPETLMIQLNNGDWEHRVYWGADRIPFGGIGADTPGHRPGGTLPPAGSWQRLEVDPAHVGLQPGSVVDGMAFAQFGGTVYWDRAGLHTARADIAVGGPPAAVLAALAAEHPDSEGQAAIEAHWRNVAPQLADERALLARITAEQEDLDSRIPRTLAIVSMEPRIVRILPRGNWMDESGEIVEPATPAFLPALAPTSEPPTRLDLARWLVAPQNPLTARVLVNRLWRLVFGEGLARSVDDFGSQGEWPDHLELLDHLALDLIESGWDVRALIRRMVTSRAYRQSSALRPELAQLDPENRLFARQVRRRIDAEFVRDVALAASGLLVRDIGGPSVKPYQPVGYWRELNFPQRSWQHDKDAGLHRRGMYTFWCRTFLHPTMKAFDAPPREECTARRASSNTPLQALSLLNDPAFVEAARVLAERVITAGESDEDRLDELGRRVLSRAPEGEERVVLLDLLAEHRAQYARDPDAARALLSVGERRAPTTLEPIGLAAWTSLARVVLNLGEAITRR